MIVVRVLKGAGPGVLALEKQRGQLDEAHLDRWAATLGVTDLLEKARRAIAEL